MNWLVEATFSLFFCYVSCSFKSQYYEKLISQRSAEAEVYKLPQSNEEFRAGYQSSGMNDGESYDFVIVGAGSAGNVLATRLSEIDDFTILLLEAGGEEDDFSNIPDFELQIQFSDKNWGYFSTPQNKSCLGMKDNKCMLARGKLIGGCSAINSAMYVRGNAKDYDKWGKENPGWSYKDVLPYFIKSENSEIDGDKCYHGKGGLWNVEYAKPASPLLSNFIDGASELNVPKLDYNGRNQFGVDRTQFNTKCGQRQSTGTAFLTHARKRTNLKVTTKALVTKVNIDSQSKVAKGVEFITNDKKFRVRARKEVILCGGTINSPQLLMLSGIGPKNHLEKMRIKVIADLPVGKNLWDHPLFPGLIIRTNYTAPNYTMEEQIDQYLNGLGPFTKPSAVEAVAFKHIGNTSEDVPMVEYVLSSQGSNTGSMLNKALNYNDDFVANFLGNINPTNDMIIHETLLHEESRGEVTLKSSNPIDFPNINLNMLAKQKDVDNLIEAIEFVLNLLETKAFKKINARLVDYPICTEYSKYSKQYWECAIRHLTTTLYHYCGTTRMGPDPKTSVVDRNAKVHGFHNLRVVDAGIFPVTLSGHTNAPTIMSAEKIADEIKRFYGYFTCAN